MDVLKNAAIIPISASQCGLITKSDAERLVSMLLDRNPPLASLSGFRAKVWYRPNKKLHKKNIFNFYEIYYSSNQCIKIFFSLHHFPFELSILVSEMLEV